MHLQALVAPSERQSARTGSSAEAFALESSPTAAILEENRMDLHETWFLEPGPPISAMRILPSTSFGSKLSGSS